jgi:hypothetical protein
MGSFLFSGLFDLSWWGFRRGGADVDAYHHRRRHDVTPLGAPRARPELKRSASLNGTSD